MHTTYTYKFWPHMGDYEEFVAALAVAVSLSMTPLSSWINRYKSVMNKKERKKQRASQLTLAS